MSERWHYVASDRVFEFFDSCGAKERRRLLDAMERVTADPYMRAHGFSVDDTGRPISLLWLNGFEIIFWLDHFVKEVRVVEVSKL